MGCGTAPASPSERSHDGATEEHISRVDKSRDSSVASRRNQDTTIAPSRIKSSTAPRAGSDYNLHLDAIIGEQASAHPDRVALTDGVTHFTYAGLYAEVQRRAQLLTAHDLPEGSLVAIPAARTIDTVLNIASVVSAHYAWVPVNPDLPPHRQRFILADSGARLALGNPDDLANFSEAAGKTTATEGPAEPPGKARPGSQVETRRLTVEGDSSQLSTDAAYVIYTSGSTGEPKGVEITRANLESMLRFSARQLGFEGTDVFSMLHSPAFDYSVWEMWNAFTVGARLVVASDADVHDMRRLLTLLINAGVTVLHLVPSVLRRLVETARRESISPPVIRYLLTGGESFDADSVHSWIALNHTETKPPRVVNLYGPTECTVAATWEDIDLRSETSGAGHVSIGWPLPDTEILIVDNDQVGTAAGQPGELLISSDRVSPGYVNRPTLNAERFVSVNTSSGPRRFYRTGDIVSSRPDGRLQFAGRADDQVKINGHRIELGDVTAALRSLSDVADCALTVFSDVRGALRLGAVVVLEVGSAANSSGVRSQLVGKLPLTAIPVRIVIAESLPLSTSGKVDRQEIARLLAS